MSDTFGISIDIHHNQMLLAPVQVWVFNFSIGSVF